MPNAFHPYVNSSITMNRSIERVEYLAAQDQIQMSWKKNFTDATFQNATYDYAIISAPFSKVRSWRFLNTSK